MKSVANDLKSQGMIEKISRFNIQNTGQFIKYDET